jgi:hypothetical protein
MLTDQATGPWPRPGSRSGVPACAPDLVGAGLVVPARMARDGWIPPVHRRGRGRITIIVFARRLLVCPGTGRHCLTSAGTETGVALHNPALRGMESIDLISEQRTLNPRVRRCRSRNSTPVPLQNVAGWLTATGAPRGAAPARQAAPAHPRPDAAAHAGEPGPKVPPSSAKQAGPAVDGPTFCRLPGRCPPSTADSRPSRCHGGSSRLRRQTPSATVAAIARYTWFRYTFLQVNRTKGYAGIPGALQVNLGAGAYRAIWGYGVGPPSDINPHLRSRVPHVSPIRPGIEVRMPPPCAEPDCWEQWAIEIQEPGGSPSRWLRFLARAIRAAHYAVTTAGGQHQLSTRSGNCRK